MRPPPPDDGYSRVSNPERFGVLRVVADELIMRLAEQFDVTVTEEDPATWDGPQIVDIRRVVRITPRDGSAASIALAYGGFPGLGVRVGRWFASAYPVCGCDACDEDPDELADEIRDLVDAVTDGRFRERKSRSWIHADLLKDGHVSQSRGTGLPKGDPRRKGRSEVLDWCPWPRRMTPAAPRSPR